MSSISTLSETHRASFGVGAHRRPKRLGWSPERRARQAALVRRIQPWRRSTGPRTTTGKARIAMNALRHGYRSRAWLAKAKRIRDAIRLCADTLLLVRVLKPKREHLAHQSPSEPYAASRQWQSPTRSCMRT